MRSERKQFLADMLLCDQVVRDAEMSHLSQMTAIKLAEILLPMFSARF